MTDTYTTYWHEHYGMLYYWLLSKVKSKEIAEDIAAQAFLQAWEKRGSLRTLALFKPWLYQIAANLAKAHWRRKPMEALDDPDKHWMDQWVERDCLPALEEKSEADHYALKIEALPPKLKRALLLQACGHTMNEIAARLRIPRSTVGTRLFNARRRLIPA